MANSPKSQRLPSFGSVAAPPRELNGIMGHVGPVRIDDPGGIKRSGTVVDTPVGAGVVVTVVTPAAVAMFVIDEIVKSVLESKVIA